MSPILLLNSLQIYLVSDLSSSAHVSGWHSGTPHPFPHTIRQPAQAAEATAAWHVVISSLCYTPYCYIVPRLILNKYTITLALQTSTYSQNRCSGHYRSWLWVWGLMCCLMFHHMMKGSVLFTAHFGEPAWPLNRWLLLNIEIKARTNFFSIYCWFFVNSC